MQDASSKLGFVAQALGLDVEDIMKQVMKRNLGEQVQQAVREVLVSSAGAEIASITGIPLSFLGAIRGLNRFKFFRTEDQFRFAVSHRLEPDVLYSFERILPSWGFGETGVHDLINLLNRLDKQVSMRIARRDGIALSPAVEDALFPDSAQ